MSFSLKVHQWNILSYKKMYMVKQSHNNASILTHCSGVQSPALNPPPPPTPSNLNPGAYSMHRSLSFMRMNSLTEGAGAPSTPLENGLASCNLRGSITSDIMSEDNFGPLSNVRYVQRKIRIYSSVKSILFHLTIALYKNHLHINVLHTREKH